VKVTEIHKHILYNNIVHIAKLHSDIKY